MHNFSYRKFSMICLKGEEAFFWFGSNFLKVLRFRKCSFFKHANYLCLPSFSGVICGFFAASYHECFILSFQAHDIAVFWLFILFSYGFVQQIKIYFGWYLFLQAINYVFAFFGRFLVGNTSSKYCLMTVFCRVLFFYNYSF